MTRHAGSSSRPIWTTPFSCGRLLGGGARLDRRHRIRRHSAARCAGAPWDRRAGFQRADEARARRDRRALARLDAQPVWLDFLDDQYGRPAASAAIAARVAREIDAHDGFGVLAPAACSTAIICSAAGRAVAAGARTRRTRGARVALYEDVPYRRIAGLMAGA